MRLQELAPGSVRKQQYFIDGEQKSTYTYRNQLPIQPASHLYQPTSQPTQPNPTTTTTHQPTTAQGEGECFYRSKLPIMGGW